MTQKDMCCQETHVHNDVVDNVLNHLENEEILFDVAELFKIFGDSTRIRILSSLTQAELCVCDICSVLNMNKSAVSHQLRILRQSKLVKNRRSGKEVYYSLVDDHVLQIINIAIEHVKE